MTQLYTLQFPSTLTTEHVFEWLWDISGSLGRTRDSAPLVFEILATAKGIQRRLRVPWQRKDYIVPQLYGYGIRVTPDEENEQWDWNFACELALTSSGRPLNIPKPATLSHRIRKTLQPLMNEEAVLLQWVINGAPARAKPEYQRAKTDRVNARTLFFGTDASRDEVQERREKLEEPNFAAVLRVAAFAESKNHARHLIRDRVRAALKATNTSNTRFVRRVVPMRALIKRIQKRATPLHYPMRLSASEMTGLIAWPVDGLLAPGEPPTIGRHYPPSDHILKKGLVVGNSVFAGAERPIAIGWDEALMHTWVGGSTGTGKSALLANMARQIMDGGFGLILIETNGNLYEAVLDYVPKERVDDVVLLDVQDSQYPVGLNLLDQGHPLSVIDRIIDLFNYMYKGSLWADQHLYFGLRTIVATPGLGFTDLPGLLVPKADEIAWGDQVIRDLAKKAGGDPELNEVVRWWQEQDNRDRRERQQRADPVLNRIWQLASRPELRAIMGQSKSSFQFSDVLRDGKILLINLKGVSRKTATLAGTLIIDGIRTAVESVHKNKPGFILVDEWADMMDLPVDFESMLAQFRKQNTGLVLANQYMGQLTSELREGLMNARNKVVLTTNAEDGRYLSRQMGHGLEEVDFTSLQKYEAQAQVLTPVGISPPVTIGTIAPQHSRGQAPRVISQSRKSYGRNLAEVYDELANRHKPKEDPNRKRPSIGGA